MHCSGYCGWGCSCGCDCDCDRGCDWRNVIGVALWTAYGAAGALLLFMGVTPVNGIVAEDGALTTAAALKPRGAESEGTALPLFVLLLLLLLVPGVRSASGEPTWEPPGGRLFGVVVVVVVAAATVVPRHAVEVGAARPEPVSDAGLALAFNCSINGEMLGECR